MTTRRDFLRVMAAGSGALMLGFRLGEAAEGPRPFQPNAWITIGSDGLVTLRAGKSEMGQGVRTSLPMILAEELDADFESIRIEQASPGPDFRRLGTGGSSSASSSWGPLREAGATARAMLVAAAAARWSVPAESLTTRSGTVMHSASGRSASYGELAAAASALPVPTGVPLRKKESFRIVGTSRRRIDGRDIVTGQARYGADVRLPGMRYAVVARAPQLGAKLGSFDAKRCRETAGVRAVFAIPTGVAVVADTTWAALRGREALEITWGPSPHASFDSDQHARDLEKATETPGITIRKDGEGRAGFEGAGEIVEAVYHYPFEAHAPVEPLNCTVLVEDGKATIWSPTQTPNGVHAAAAELLGLPEAAVTVNVTLLGGGFGRRLGVDFDREAIEIARQLRGTPVQLLWSREDDMRHGYFQAASAHRMRAAISEGKVVAWEHRKASTLHNARRQPTAEQMKDPGYLGGSAWGVMETPYFFPAAEMSYAVGSSPVPIGPWRSVYSPPSVFAREAFLDEVAQRLGRDPLELRLALLGHGDPSITPEFSVGDSTYDRSRLVRVLQTAARKAGWTSRLGKGRARGIACNVFHNGASLAYVVEVSLRKDARPDQLPFVVDRVVCAIDCGLAINPSGVAQQVESGVIWSLSNMKGAITVRNGSVEQSSYGDFPVVMIDETPRSIETHLVDGGLEVPLGVGEPTVCPLAPAVVNALSRLTGKRIRALPVRLS